MKILLILALAILSASCGPGFVNPVIAPEVLVDQIELSKISSRDNGQFYLKAFTDNRSDKTLLKYDSSTYATDSDLLLVVREGISRALVRVGFIHSKEASVFISGKLEEWECEIKDGFPSTITCSSKIYLELLDPIDKRIYSGRYSGKSELQSPGLNNDDLRKALSLAMNKAVEQIVKDAGLTSILNSY